jgi:hypothetical protein
MVGWEYVAIAAAHLGDWEAAKEAVRRMLGEHSAGNHRRLAKVGDASPAVPPLRAMRAACREFLTEPHPDFPHTGQDRHHGRRAFRDGFFVALGKLRGTFGQQLAVLAYLYDIDIEAESWPRSCRPNRGQAMIVVNARWRARPGWESAMRSL